MVDRSDSLAASDVSERTFNESVMDCVPERPVRLNSFLRKPNQLIEAQFTRALRKVEALVWNIGLVKLLQNESLDGQNRPALPAELCSVQGGWGVVVISVDELRQFGVLTSSNRVYEELRRIGGELRSSVEVCLQSGGEFKKQFTSAIRTYAPGRGRILLQFDERLKPFLAVIDGNHTVLRLLDLARLSCKDSASLWERLLRHVREDGEPATVSLPLEAVRTLCGTAPEKYPAWRHFDLYVLRRIVEDINTNGRLRIEYVPIKRGRVVESVSFTVMPASGAQALAQAARKAVMELLRERGVNTQGALHVLSQYSLSAIVDALCYAEFRGKPSEPGYIMRALKDAYASNAECQAFIRSTIPRHQEDIGRRMMGSLGAGTADGLYVDFLDDLQQRNPKLARFVELNGAHLVRDHEEVSRRFASFVAMHGIRCDREETELASPEAGRQPLGSGAESPVSLFSN